MESTAVRTKSIRQRIRGALRFTVQSLLIGLLRAYQWGISPFMGSRCRFYPSCSHYAVEALQRFGPIKGSWLVLRRLGKCHPWHPGGVDMVPESE